MLRTLVLVLLVIVSAACFSGRRKPGTNTHIPGSGDEGQTTHGDPPALVDQGR